MRRMPMLVGTWLLATGFATTLAWGAVRQVELHVTDQAPVLSQARVEDAVGARGGALRESDVAPVPTSVPVAEPGVTGTPPPGAGGSQSPSGTSSGGNVGGTTSPPPAVPPAASPAPPTGGVSPLVAVGGSASFRCSDGDAILVSAQPRSGFTATMPPGNQSTVDFTSSTHKSVIDAECVGGTVRGYVEEEAL